MSDFATNFLTLGTQFRYPTEEELERARSSKMGKAQTLAEGAAWGVADMLTGELTSALPSAARRVSRGAKKGINELRSAAKKVNPLVRYGDLGDKYKNIAKEYDKLTNLNEQIQFAKRAGKDDVRRTISTTLRQDNSVLSKPTTKSKSYLDKIDEELIQNIPSKELPGGLLEYDNVRTLHGAYEPHNTLSVGHPRTGEGAQAFGPGLYASDSPGVHKYYMKPFGYEINYRPRSSGNKLRFIDQEAFDFNALPKEEKDKFIKALAKNTDIKDVETLLASKNSYKTLFESTDPATLLKTLRDDLGIQGTRYRANTPSAKTRMQYNYTLFDDELIDIIDSNFDKETIDNIYKETKALPHTGYAGRTLEELRDLSKSWDKEIADALQKEELFTNKASKVLKKANEFYSKAAKWKKGLDIAKKGIGASIPTSVLGKGIKEIVESRNNEPTSEDKYNRYRSIIKKQFEGDEEAFRKAMIEASDKLEGVNFYNDYLELKKEFKNFQNGGTVSKKNLRKMKEGGVTKKSNISEQVGELSNAPYEMDPLNVSKALYSHFSQQPERYKMSGRALDVNEEALSKYPSFSKWYEKMPVKPRRYTTGRDLETGQDFAYPAFDLEDIQNYSFGGILSDTASMAGIGSAFGPIGTAIGGGLGLVKGLIGHSKEKKEEERLEGMQQNTNLERIRGMQTSQSVNNPYAATFPMGGTIPYSLAELEKEEVMQAPDGDMSMVDGPTHAQGGVPVMAEEGTRVYSDRLKTEEGKTFAEVAEKIGKKKAKAEEVLNDTNADDISRTTAERNLANYQKKLDELFMQQESMKPASEQGQEYDLGGVISAAGKWLGKNSDKIVGGLEMAGQLAPIGYNIYQGLQPEQELNASEFYNPQANQAMSLMANRRFNVDPTLRANEGAYRTALSNIKSASGGNRGQLLGNVGGAMRGMQSANAQAYAQKQNMDNQYMAQEAQMRAGLGSERAQTDLMISDLNTRNEAARRAFLGQAAGQLGQFSQAQAVNRGMRERDEMLLPLMQDYLGMLGDRGGSNNNLNFQAPQLNWSPSDMSLNPYGSTGGYGSALTKPRKTTFEKSYKGI